MNGYAVLAPIYDELTRNVGYRRRAAYVHRWFKKNKVSGIVLDAGCGTGTLALLLAGRGYDLIAADISEEMLGMAAAKAAATGAKIQFIKQDLAELDLYGTVSGIVCMQDTLNHLGGGLPEAIRRFSLFLEPGGMLICDINTPYKHAEILGNNTFRFPFRGGECRWSNQYDPAEGRLALTIEMIENSRTAKEVIARDVFDEYDIDPANFEAMLHAAGLKVIKKLDGERYRLVRANTQRVLYAARKNG